MDFKHVGASKHRLRLLQKFGKKSLLVGIAVVSGLALKSKVVGSPWGSQRLYASSPPNAENSGGPVFSTPADHRPWNFDWDKRNPVGNLDVGHVEGIISGSGQAVDGKIQGWNKSMAPETDQFPHSTARRHVLLIRHGQYTEEGELDQEHGLTTTGRFQAETTAMRLDELGLPFTTMTASTMRRAKETALLIHRQFPELELVYDDVLREGAPAVPQPPTDVWQPRPCQFFQDGARIENAFRKYIHRAEPEQEKDSFDVIVCHANVIRYFTCRALQFPLSGWIRLSIANCSLTMITIHPDGTVVLEMMGDHGHIPAQNVTF